MSLLSDFEADLMRLIYVYYRFSAIYKEFPNQMIDDQHHLLVRGILREITVEQLHNFIIIRKDLLRNNEFKKLDDVIYPLIKPILDKEEPIKQLRHNYIAHVQENDRKFKILIQEICEKYDLPTAFGYWRYLDGLAFFYIGIVNANFHVEYNKAHEKYNAMLGEAIVIPSEFTMANSISKIGEIMNPLHLELTKRGYKTVLGDKELDQLRKMNSKNDMSNSKL